MKREEEELEVEEEKGEEQQQQPCSRRATSSDLWRFCSDAAGGERTVSPLFPPERLFFFFFFLQRPLSNHKALPRELHPSQDTRLCVCARCSRGGRRHRGCCFMRLESSRTETGCHQHTELPAPTVDSLTLPVSTSQPSCCSCLLFPLLHVVSSFCSQSQPPSVSSIGSRDGGEANF